MTFYYYIPISIALGWIAGMLTNYFSDTLPFTRKFSAPACLNCNANQRIINYLFWPRRCPSCNHRRANRTWIVEVIFIAISLWLCLNPLLPLGYPASLLLFTYFGVVTVIDIEHRLILHPVSIVGALICLGLGIWLHGIRSTAIGGIAGFLIMLLLYFLGHFVMRMMARLRGETIDEEALGFGDVNLSGVIGLLLGWPGVLAGIFLTIFIAGISSLVYLLSKIFLKQYKPDLALPYGPFLVASAIFLIYFRNLF